MKTPTVVITVALLLVGILITTSCQSSKPASAAMMPSPAGRATQTPANDYSKPYLTDEKMQKFLASKKEEHNPLELIFCSEIDQIEQVSTR